MPSFDNKPSAKQRQIRLQQSRKRWATFFGMATGFGVLLLASMVWPWQDTDRDDTDHASGSTVQEHLSATD